MASENQNTPSENTNFELVKSFERKYNVRLTKDKVIEVQYLSKWNIK